MVSPAGIRWTPAQEQPLITATPEDRQFDSPLSAFWDQRQNCYRIYVRGWQPDDPDNRIRAIRCSTSQDFLHWTPWRYIHISGQEQWSEHLYTNAAHPYYRAPYYLMFPKRYVPQRTFNASWQHPGQSDVLFLASRDGQHWSRPFREAFLRPGHDPDNWHERSIFIGPGAVPTAAGELSLYSIQKYHTERVCIRRLSLREDGFISINAPFTGGSMTTKPLTFSGHALKINYATSAAGSVHVEILDPDGRALLGYKADECNEIFGDELDRQVTWNAGHTLADLAGKPVRLRFILEDADLFSFRFIGE
jgi:hypothetical protein